jgi:hypothetical protein
MAWKSRQGAASLLAAAALVLAAAAALPSATAQAGSGCTLTLYLNASASTITMDGSAVTAPIQQQLVPTYPNALVGFEGALVLSLPSGPCPSTAAALQQQLAGATLQTTNATGPLLLYPAADIQVRCWWAGINMFGRQFCVCQWDVPDYRCVCAEGIRVLQLIICA